MESTDSNLEFQQIHIEVARNATDDFNPFHDKNRWHRIQGNPFGGSITLGFQLECLIEYRVRLHREAQKEQALMAAHGLRYGNYQFSFANAVRCDEPVTVEVKPSQLREGENTTLSNRVCLKAAGRAALLGYKRESRLPLVLPDTEPGNLGDLAQLDSPGYLPDRSFYLTRKYVMTGNAKNFLSGSLVEQADYIDELDNRVEFPETFPCAMISCALLQQGVEDGLDFMADPLVYTNHKMSIDRELLAGLCSNDALNLLVRRIEPYEATRHYECFGLVGDNAVLFRAQISLVPLAAIPR